jgi:hypothetical protein
MRTSVAVLLVAGLVLGTRSVNRADDQADARALIARAIQARGGEKRLAQYKAQAWKEKATYYGMEDREQYEATYTAGWPDKLKVTIGDFTLVVNGDTGWVNIKGKTREMTREELEEHKEGTYSVWVMSLLPLRDNAFKLALLGERKVGDRPAAGVKVSRKGHFDVNLYFDKATGLLTQSETRYKEARSGKKVNQEMTFSDYKDVSGIKTPTRVSIKRDGKRVVEAALSDLKYLDKLADSVFAKP